MGIGSGVNGSNGGGLCSGYDAYLEGWKEGEAIRLRKELQQANQQAGNAYNQGFSDGQQDGCLLGWNDGTCSASTTRKRSPRALKGVACAGLWKKTPSSLSRCLQHIAS